MADMQPDSVPTPAPALDSGKLTALGQKLAADFAVYERDRRDAERRWVQNLRQFLGKYDPEIEAKLPGDRSKAYPKLTRIKCVSMVSRLMNLLFPSSEKNWGVEPSPVPNLSTEDLQAVLDKLQQDPNAQLDDQIITNAVHEFAKERGRNLEVEIADQLTELGGAKRLDYTALCKRVLMSGVMYGAGVLKGPMARSRAQRRWTLNPETNKVEAVTLPILIPQYEFVPIWDYYPDMSAKYLHQMDGQFQRIVMSRAQVRKLADNSEFLGSVIKKYLQDHQTGNYKAKQYETEIKTLGVHTNTMSQDSRKYEVMVWDGGLSGAYLKGCGINIPEEKLIDMIPVIIWFIDNTVIRVTMNPWAIVGEDDPISTYHHFIFEEDEAGLLGNGLPFIMRDSQLGVSASARMILDNSGVVCGTNLEVNTALLRPDQDVSSIHAYKVWYRDDDSPATINARAVQSVPIDSHIPELLQVNELFRNFADQETFVNPATGGDFQKGPSEPFRTAAGASMLQGQAALPFKDVVRNFDIFTESVIGGLVTFNKHFNQKESIKGDFQAVSRGSTSLIAKEVRGMGYDELARSLQPEERLYIDWRKLLKERLNVRDMDASVAVDDAEAKRREEAQAQQQAQQSEAQQKMVAAEIRKTLAEAVKNLTQADKNQASAEAATYTALLDGLEKGVAPDEVAEARAGGGVPDGIAAVHELKHPKPPARPPAAKKKAS
jgi:ribosomal protein L22